MAPCAINTILLLLFLLVIVVLLLTHTTYSLLKTFCDVGQLQELEMQGDVHSIERLTRTCDFIPSLLLSLGIVLAAIRCLSTSFAVH